MGRSSHGRTPRAAGPQAARGAGREAVSGPRRPPGSRVRGRRPLPGLRGSVSYARPIGTSHHRPRTHHSAAMGPPGATRSTRVSEGERRTRTGWTWGPIGKGSFIPLHRHGPQPVACEHRLAGRGRGGARRVAGRARGAGHVAGELAVVAEHEHTGAGAGAGLMVPARVARANTSDASDASAGSRGDGERAFIGSPFVCGILSSPGHRAPGVTPPYGCPSARGLPLFLRTIVRRTISVRGRRAPSSPCTLPLP